eukprot:756247-Hanusia_phi.AAC.3
MMVAREAGAVFYLLQSLLYSQPPRRATSWAQECRQSYRVQEKLYQIELHMTKLAKSRSARRGKCGSALAAWAVAIGLDERSCLLPLLLSAPCRSMLSDTATSITNFHFH